MIDEEVRNSLWCLNYITVQRWSRTYLFFRLRGPRKTDTYFAEAVSNEEDTEADNFVLTSLRTLGFNVLEPGEDCMGSPQFIKLARSKPSAHELMEFYSKLPISHAEASARHA